MNEHRPSIAVFLGGAGIGTGTGSMDPALGLHLTNYATGPVTVTRVGLIMPDGQTLDVAWESLMFRGPLPLPLVLQ